ncbi:MAG: methyltransferase domain-containing protein, partial [Thermoplasmata archaeon]|nr:methyltransferase domain-containing protein [Thermoplasmata archaeon]
MGMRISVIIYTYYFITELMASEKAKVERRYDRWSRYYDTVDTFPGIGRLEKRWRLEAIESLELKPDDMVLDVGTGTGLILPWIAERLTTGKVMGIDLSENMLEKARERAGKCGVEDRVELRKMDIEKMGFEDGSFDKVI